MLGFSNRVEVLDGPPPPKGVKEVVFCVFDDRGHVRHHFRATDDHHGFDPPFSLLADPEKAVQSELLRGAFAMRKPFSSSFSHAEGWRSYLHVLPYERKRNKWRFACMQICTAKPDPDSVQPAAACAMDEERLCLILAGEDHSIRSVSARVPRAFGYDAGHLMDMNLRDLFSDVDIGIIGSCSADTNESILSCVLHCLDGSKRDIEIRKFTAPDHGVLYALCDTTQPQLLEEMSLVGVRERRRIGQDLHDSIGQMLTGISLLSRSLANDLKRSQHPGAIDAAQISALSDDASNQIRQISRGLMPSEIVKKGLSASLEELARTTTESCKLSCEAVTDDTISFSDGAVESHLYRIAQEAVNNAVRHAEASHILIEMSQINGMPQLQVVDNGTWKPSAGNVAGIGMRTMEYRASAIGARLKIDKSSGSGTRVICLLEAEDALATRV